MSVNINKVQLQGRIAKFFDLKYFPDGTPSLALTLATSEFYSDKEGARQEQSEFHRVVIVGKGADTIQTHAVVGQEMYFEGKLKHRSFGEGAQRQFITEVRVDGNDFQFGSKPRGSSSTEASKSVGGQRTPARR